MAKDMSDEAPEGQLVLDLDGYEGPIDVLLTLARDQKVDLTRISILQLADQYLAFVAEARRIRLELAADYLVMAAWLAYLKSRLLLPEQDEEEPSGEDLAQALAFQLQRLEAMQEVGAKLVERPRLGRDVFARGAPEGIQVVSKSIFDLSLYDLLKAYTEHKRKEEYGTWRIPANRAVLDGGRAPAPVGDAGPAAGLDLAGKLRPRCRRKFAAQPFSPGRPFRRQPGTDQGRQT